MRGFTFGLAQPTSARSWPAFFNVSNPYRGYSDLYPSLPIPLGFWNGGMKDSAIVFRNPNGTIKKEVKVPAADPITSEYGMKTMPKRFTLALINFVNGKFPFHFGQQDARLRYAVEVYRILDGLPSTPLVVLPAERSVRTTLSFYLDNTLNLTFLEMTLPERKPFLDRLTRLQYSDQTKSTNVSSGEAESFLNDVDKEISDYLGKKISDENLKVLLKPEKEENVFYTIDAGIVLESEAIEVLNKIGPLYFKETGKKFNVNSGTRDARRQADAMLGVIEAGSPTLPKYTNRVRVDEIRAAYKKAKAEGKSRADVVSAMEAVIQKQIGEGYFISRHLKAGAIDISVKGDTGVPPMSKSEQSIMIKVAKSVITKGDAFYENDPPHIHVQFK